MDLHSLKNTGHLAHYGAFNWVVECTSRLRGPRFTRTKYVFLAGTRGASTNTNVRISRTERSLRRNSFPKRYLQMYQRGRVFLGIWFGSCFFCMILVLIIFGYFCFFFSVECFR